mgnify:CR=1 FL=1
MAKIHWLIYIIVGLFVSISSWRIDYEDLYIFFYAGLVFILIGIAKLIFGLNIKKEKSITKHHAQGAKYCHNCGYAARLHDKFCSKCGVRI